MPVKAALLLPNLYSWHGVGRWVLSLARHSDPELLEWIGAAIFMPDNVDPSAVRELSRYMPVCRDGDLNGALRKFAHLADVLVTWGSSRILGAVDPIPIPVVLVSHTTNWWPGVHVDRIQHFAAVSEAAAVPFRNVAENVTVVPNGAEVERVTPRDPAGFLAELGEAGEHRLLGYLGRYDATKELDALLPLLDDPGVRLVMLGKPLTSTESPLAEHPRVIAMPPRTHVGDFLATIDCLVHPTTSEAFGLAIVEAWLAGTPVCSPATGIVPELEATHGALRWDLAAAKDHSYHRQCPRVALARELAWKRFTAGAMADRWAKYLKLIRQQAGPKSMATVLPAATVPEVKPVLEPFADPTGVSDKIPKRMYFYSGFQKLSFLRWMSIASFCHHHPDFEVVVYEPYRFTGDITWQTGEQSGAYDGPDYHDWLRCLPVEVWPFDMESIGLSNDLPEVHKSDILRNWLLAEKGGYWSDMDIVYTKPLAVPASCDTIVCYDGEHWLIAFLGASPGNAFFRELTDHCLDKRSVEDYQGFGAKVYTRDLATYQWRYGQHTFYNLPMEKLFPFRWAELGKYLKDEPLEGNFFGVHWFGGAPTGTRLERELRHDTADGDYPLYRLIRQIQAQAGWVPPATGRYSILIPCDEDRFPELVLTLERYRELGIERHEYEVLVPTRSLNEETHLKHLQAAVPNVRLLPYQYEGEYFNPVKALNLAARSARYDQLIVQSPEVYPLTDVLTQFACLGEGNYVARVWDSDQAGNYTAELTASDRFIKDLAGRYFLACYRKADVELINGWDEDFMGGYCFDDNDFGHRWALAGLPISLRMDIRAVHRWHARFPGQSEGWQRNRELFEMKACLGRARCDHGLQGGS